MGLEREKRYLREEPRRFVKPNRRLAAPFIIELGFAVHPSTAENFGEALSERDQNVWLNAQPRKEKKEDLEAALEQAKSDARTIYYRKQIESGEVDLHELNALLERIPLTLFAKARGLIALIEDPHVTVKNEPLKVGGYSQGGPAAIVAAVLRPDLFPSRDEERSTLVLINPAGITGKRESESRAVRAAEKVRDDRKTTLAEKFGNLGRTARTQWGYLSGIVVEALTKPHMGGALKDSLQYVGAHTLSGEVDREAHDMANTDMVPFINFLSRRMRLIVIYDEDDRTFPAKTIDERRESDDFEGNVEFYKTSGMGHFGPIHNSKKMSETVMAALQGGRG